MTAYSGMQCQIDPFVDMQGFTFQASMIIFRITQQAIYSTSIMQQQDRQIDARCQETPR